MFRSIFSDEPHEPYDWEKGVKYKPERIGQGKYIELNKGSAIHINERPNELFYDPYIWKPIGDIDWVKINSYWKHCIKDRAASQDLLRSINDEIKEAIYNKQEVIVLFSTYDAVKNEGFDPARNLSTNQEEIRRLYKIFPEYWKRYSYEEKAESIRELQMLDDRPVLNVKEWSLQQWPHNLIRYCMMNNIKLIYIQADHTYCKFPSAFAEAMANTLYTHYQILHNYNYCFKGPNNTLYCVGDVAVADDILKYIQTNYTDINIVGNDKLLAKGYPKINPDINWVRMSDSYVNDIFSRILRRIPCCSDFSYFNYPWDIIVSRSHEPIIPITIKLNGTPVTGTYISDIFPSKEYSYSLISTKRWNDYNISRPIGFSAFHLPLNYIAPNNASFRYNVPIYYTKRIVPNSIFYDGTYTCPTIFVDNIPVEQELKDKVLFQALAYEMHF